jgi:hypothetical protein
MKAISYLVLFASLGAVSATAATPRPRVFFVEPKNAATVKSPLHLKFGIANYKIGAVPDGTVTTARPGIGHFHLGIDTPCLAAGQTIVKGTPSWVHFGKGDAEFDTQLTPGKHRLALQLADDLHNAIKGACTTITVNVAP